MSELLKLKQDHHEKVEGLENQLSCKKKEINELRTLLDDVKSLKSEYEIKYSQEQEKRNTEQAEKIRSLEYSAKEVMLTFIERIMSVNAELNAVVGDRFEDALQQAQQIDEMLQILNEKERKNLQEMKPFLGVPFTAKEAIAISGLPNTSGLVSRKEFIAEQDA